MIKPSNIFTRDIQKVLRMSEERRVVLQNHWAVTGQIRKCEASFWPYLNTKISHERQQDRGYKSKRWMEVRKVKWSDVLHCELIMMWMENVWFVTALKWLDPTAVYWNSQQHTGLQVLFLLLPLVGDQLTCVGMCTHCVLVAAPVISLCINVFELEMQFNIHWQNKGSTCGLKIEQKQVFQCNAASEEANMWQQLKCCDILHSCPSV